MSAADENWPKTPRNTFHPLASNSLAVDSSPGPTRREFLARRNLGEEGTNGAGESSHRYVNSGSIFDGRFVGAFSGSSQSGATVVLAAGMSPHRSGRWCGANKHAKTPPDGGVLALTARGSSRSSRHQRTPQLGRGRLLEPPAGDVDQQAATDARPLPTASASLDHGYRRKKMLSTIVATTERIRHVASGT